VRFDVREDRGAQLGDAGVGATLERLFGQEAEEALHGVQPRGVGRGEVELDAGMAEPLTDGRRLVGRQVVQDDVNLESRVHLFLDLAKEDQEVLCAMTLLAARDDLASRHVQGGEQVEHSVTNVVVGLPFRLADVHGQDGLRPLEGLNLGLLVEGKQHRVAGRIHVQATTSRTLATNCGSGDILNERETFRSHSGQFC